MRIEYDSLQEMDPEIRESIIKTYKVGSSCIGLYTTENTGRGFCQHFITASNYLRSVREEYAMVLNETREKYGVCLVDNGEAYLVVADRGLGNKGKWVVEGTRLKGS
jgi:hypothetical protein